MSGYQLHNGKILVEDLYKGYSPSQGGYQLHNGKILVEDLYKVPPQDEPSPPEQPAPKAEEDEGIGSRIYKSLQLGAHKYMNEVNPVTGFILSAVIDNLPLTPIVASGATEFLGNTAQYSKNPNNLSAKYDPQMAELWNNIGGGLHTAADWLRELGTENAPQYKPNEKVNREYTSALSGGLGNLLDMLGANKAGGALNEISQATHVRDDERPAPDFTLDYLLHGLPVDAAQLAGSMTSIVPFMGLAPEALVARGVMGLGGSALERYLLSRGLPTAAKMVRTGLPQAARYGLTSAPVEGIMEGGDLRRQLLAQGYSPEEATKRAWIAAGENIPMLMATNTLEGLSYFTPLAPLRSLGKLGKGIQIGGRGLFNAGQEASEEAWQEAIQANQLGRDWGVLPFTIDENGQLVNNWSPEQWYAASHVVGPAGLFGLLGGAGQAMSSDDATEQARKDAAQRRSELTGRVVINEDGTAEYAPSSIYGKLRTSGEHWIEGQENNARQAAREAIESSEGTLDAMRSWASKHGIGDITFNHIIHYANEQGIPPQRLLAQAIAESNGDQNSVSQWGAIGVMQLMPDTARSLGVDPYDLEDNIRGGAIYLRQQYDRFGDWDLAHAAYNAGPGAVEKAGNAIPNFSETQNYVARINGYMEESPAYSGDIQSRAERNYYGEKQNKNGYAGENGGGRGKYWNVQSDATSFEGAQPGLLDLTDMLGKYYFDETGYKLIVNHATDGSHPSNGSGRGHSDGFKIDVQDAGEGGVGMGEDGPLFTADFQAGPFLEKFIAYGRSLGVGMNVEGLGTPNVHLDISMAGDQWDGNGESLGGFNPRNAGKPQSDTSVQNGKPQPARQEQEEEQPIPPLFDLNAEDKDTKALFAKFAEERRKQSEQSTGADAAADELFFSDMFTAKGKFKNTKENRDKIRNDEHYGAEFTAWATALLAQQQQAQQGQQQEQQPTQPTPTPQQTGTNNNHPVIKLAQKYLTQLQNNPSADNAPTRLALGKAINDGDMTAVQKILSKHGVQGQQGQQTQQTEPENVVQNNGTPENKLTPPPQQQQPPPEETQQTQPTQEQQKQSTQPAQTQPTQGQEESSYINNAFKTPDGGSTKDAARSRQLQAVALTDLANSIQLQFTPETTAKLKNSTIAGIQAAKQELINANFFEKRQQQPKKLSYTEARTLAGGEISEDENERKAQGKALVQVIDSLNETGALEDDFLPQGRRTELIDGNATTIDSFKQALAAKKIKGFTVQQAPQETTPATAQSERHYGNEANVYTAQNTQKQAPYKVRYRVAEADEIKTSHRIENGDVIENEGYPEGIQNRSRDRVAMKTDAISMANKLNPELLLDDNDANQGAPIVNKDGIVLNGNGRTMGIRYAYENGQGDAYKAAIVENADKLGLNADEIRQMKQPVLVREVAQDLRPDEFEDLITSQTGGSEYSPSERAKVDAKKIAKKPTIFNSLPQSGNLNNVSAGSFLQNLFQTIVGNTSLNGVTDNNGRITENGIRRATNALFSLAYGDDSLTKKQVENSGTKTNGILNALAEAAPTIARVQALMGMKNAPLHSYDLSVIAKAVNKLDSLRTSSTPISLYLESRNLFGAAFEDSDETKAIVKFLNDNNTHPEKFTKFLTELANGIQAQGNPNQGVVSDEMKRQPASLMELIQQATQAVQNKGQASLFDTQGGKNNATASQQTAPAQGLGSQEDNSQNAQPKQTSPQADEVKPKKRQEGEPNKLQRLRDKLKTDTYQNIGEWLTTRAKAASNQESPDTAARQELDNLLQQKFTDDELAAWDARLAQEKSAAQEQKPAEPVKVEDAPKEIVDTEPVGTPEANQQQDSTPEKATNPKAEQPKKKNKGKWHIQASAGSREALLKMIREHYGNNNLVIEDDGTVREPERNITLRSTVRNNKGRWQFGYYESDTTDTAEAKPAKPQETPKTESQQQEGRDFTEEEITLMNTSPEELVVDDKLREKLHQKFPEIKEAIDVLVDAGKGNKPVDRRAAGLWLRAKENLKRLLAADKSEFEDGASFIWAANTMRDIWGSQKAKSTAKATAVAREAADKIISDAAKLSDEERRKQAQDIYQRLGEVLYPDKFKPDTKAAKTKAKPKKNAKRLKLHEKLKTDAHPNLKAWLDNVLDTAAAQEPSKERSEALETLKEIEQKTYTDDYLADWDSRLAPTEPQSADTQLSVEQVAAEGKARLRSFVDIDKYPETETVIDRRIDEEAKTKTAEELQEFIKQAVERFSSYSEDDFAGAAAWEIYNNWHDRKFSRSRYGWMYEHPKAKYGTSQYQQVEETDEKASEILEGIREGTTSGVKAYEDIKKLLGKQARKTKAKPTENSENTPKEQAPQGEVEATPANETTDNTENAKPESKPEKRRDEPQNLMARLHQKLKTDTYGRLAIWLRTTSFFASSSKNELLKREAQALLDKLDETEFSDEELAAMNEFYEEKGRDAFNKKLANRLDGDKTQFLTQPKAQANSERVTAKPTPVVRAETESATENDIETQDTEARRQRLHQKINAEKNPLTAKYIDELIEKSQSETGIDEQLKRIERLSDEKAAELADSWEKVFADKAKSMELIEATRKEAHKLLNSERYQAIKEGVDKFFDGLISDVNHRDEKKRKSSHAIKLAVNKHMKSWREFVDANGMEGVAKEAVNLIVRRAGENRPYGDKTVMTSWEESLEKAQSIQARMESGELSPDEAYDLLTNDGKPQDNSQSTAAKTATESADTVNEAPNEGNQADTVSEISSEREEPATETPPAQANETPSEKPKTKAEKMQAAIDEFQRKVAEINEEREEAPKTAEEIQIEKDKEKLKELKGLLEIKGNTVVLKSNPTTRDNKSLKTSLETVAKNNFDEATTLSPAEGEVVKIKFADSVDADKFANDTAERLFGMIEGRHPTTSKTKQQAQPTRPAFESRADKTEAEKIFIDWQERTANHNIEKTTQIPIKVTIQELQEKLKENLKKKRGKKQQAETQDEAQDEAQTESKEERQAESKLLDYFAQKLDEGLNLKAAAKAAIEDIIQNTKRTISELEAKPTTTAEAAARREAIDDLNKTAAKDVEAVISAYHKVFNKARFDAEAQADEQANKFENNKADQNQSEAIRKAESIRNAWGRHVGLLNQANKLKPEIEEAVQLDEETEANLDILNCADSLFESNLPEETIVGVMEAMLGVQVAKNGVGKNGANFKAVKEIPFRGGKIDPQAVSDILDKLESNKISVDIARNQLNGLLEEAAADDEKTLDPAVEAANRAENGTGSQRDKDIAGGLKHYGATIKGKIIAFANYAQRAAAVNFLKAFDTLTDVWHGSPHRFSGGLSTKFIGTGNKGGSHGYGLHFAVSKEVGEHFRDNQFGVLVNQKVELTIRGKRFTYAPNIVDGIFKGVVWKDENGNLVELPNLNENPDAITEITDPTKLILMEVANTIDMAELDEELAIDVKGAVEDGDGDKATIDKALRLIADGEVQEPKITPVKDKLGSLHRVKIPPTSSMLNEQAKLSEQKADIQTAVRDAAREARVELEDDMTGKQIYDALKQKLGIEEPEKASEMLNKHGVKGIFYTDSTYGQCFVVFDDATITPIERYSRVGSKGKLENILADDELTPEQKAIVDFCEQEMGIGLHFFRSDPDIQGVYSNGVAFINVNAKVTPEWIFHHEVGHWLAHDNPQLFNNLVKMLNITAEQRDAYRQKIGRPDMTDAEADAEILCDMIGDIAQLKNLFKKMGKENYSLAERAMKWFVQALNRFTEFFFGKRFMTRTQRDKLYDQLGEVARAIVDKHGNKKLRYNSRTHAIERIDGTPLPELPKTEANKANARNYSFAGENAKTAPRTRLERAKSMDRNGKRPEDIWRETGWRKGKDGLWRFEIPDVLDKMDFSKLKRIDNRSDDEILEAVLNTYSNEIHDEDGEIIHDKVAELVERAKQAKQATLGEIYDNPQLYKAYPELKEMPVRAEKMDGARGKYSPSSKTIILDTESKNSWESTLVHEVQHAIQDIEGFAFGGLPKTVYRQLKAELNRIFNKLGTLPHNSKESNELLERAKEIRSALALVEDPKTGDFREDIDILDENTGEFLGKADEVLYQRLGGEQEAREAASRAASGESYRAYAVRRGMGGRKNLITKLKQQIGKLIAKYPPSVRSLIDEYVDAIGTEDEEARLKEIFSRMPKDLAEVIKDRRNAIHEYLALSFYLEHNMPQIHTGDALIVYGGNSINLLSFAGKNAKTADLARLDEAKHMEAEGKTPDEIFKKTGWFKGKDKKWRFEIPDPLGRMYFSKFAYAKKQPTLGQLYKDPTLTDRYPDLVNAPVFKLGEIYRNNKLYEAYPEMRDINIVVVPERVADNLGGFSMSTGAINGDVTIWMAQHATRYGEFTDYRPYLIHELQHVIQNIEDFATGGSLSNIRQELEDRLAKMNPESKEAKELKTALENYNDVGLYYHLGGEQEANIVAERAKFKQKRKETPHAHEDNAIIAFGLKGQTTESQSEQDRASSNTESTPAQGTDDAKASGNDNWTDSRINEIAKNPNAANGLRQLGATIKNGKVSFPDSKTRTYCVNFLKDITDPNFKFAIAWHGSPYVFNEFSTFEIGTGEGGQIHGWGLYFASERGVSDGYRKGLGNPRLEITMAGHRYTQDGLRLKDENGDKVRGNHPLSLIIDEVYSLQRTLMEQQEAVSEEEEDFDDWGFDDEEERDSFPVITYDMIHSRLEEQRDKLSRSTKSEADEDLWALSLPTVEDYEKALKLLEDSGSFEAKTKVGSLYKVEIPDEDVMLDEQETLDNQPPKVQAAVREIAKERGITLDDEMYGYDIYYAIEKSFRSQWGRLAAKEASLLLNKHGVKGIAYDGELDGYCYVVFDDKAIQILERFSRIGPEGELENLIDDKDLNPLQKAIVDFCKSMGVPVVFFRSHPDTQGAFGRGTAYINVNSAATPEWVFHHEVGHWLAVDNPQIFNNLVKMLDITAEQRDEYRKQTKQYQLNDDEVNAEILCNKFGDEAKRLKLFKKVGKDDTLIERVLAWLKQMVDKFADYFFSKKFFTRTERDKLYDSLGKIVRAIVDEHGNKKFRYNNRTHAIERADGTPLPKLPTTKANEAEGTKYSFAGRKAKTADKESLDRAKKMKDRGVSRDVIFQETGWFWGKDGKWRFEIPDHREQMKLNNLLGLGRLGKEFKLAEIYNNPELLAAYPKQLDKVTIKAVDPTNKGIESDLVRDSFAATIGNKIIFNADMISLDIDECEKTLVHEIQHLIQGYEDFAAGSNHETVKGKLIANRENIKQEVAKIANGRRYFKAVLATIKAHQAGNKEAEAKAYQAVQTAKEQLSDSGQLRINKLVPRYLELEEAIAMPTRTKEAKLKLYYRLGGEQEAMEVEKRLDNREGTPVAHYADALIVYGGKTYPLAKHSENKKIAAENGEREPFDGRKPPSAVTANSTTDRDTTNVAAGIDNKGGVVPNANVENDSLRGELSDGSITSSTATANGTTNRNPSETDVQADNKGGVRPSSANVETNSLRGELSDGSKIPPTATANGTTTDSHQEIGAKIDNKGGVNQSVANVETNSPSKNITHDKGRVNEIGDNDAISGKRASEQETELERDFRNARQVPERELKPHEKLWVKLGETFGVKVVWIESDNANLSGATEKGVIYLNRKAISSDGKVEKTFWHEQFHIIKAVNPKLYRELLGYFKGKLAFTKEQLDAYRRQMKRPNLTDAEVIEEILCDNFGDVQKRARLIQEMSKDNPSLIKRFIALLKYMADKVVSLFHNPQGGMTTAQRDAFIKGIGNLAGSMKDVHGNKLFTVYKNGKEITLANGEPLPNMGLKFKSNDEQTKTANSTKQDSDNSKAETTPAQGSDEAQGEQSLLDKAAKKFAKAIGLEHSKIVRAIEQRKAERKAKDNAMDELIRAERADKEKSTKETKARVAEAKKRLKELQVSDEEYKTYKAGEQFRDYLNPLQYIGASPSRIGDAVRTFRAFYQMADRALDKLIGLRERNERRYNDALNLVTKLKERETLFALLWQGDAEGEEYGKLTEDEVEAAKTNKRAGESETQAIQRAKVEKICKEKIAVGDEERNVSESVARTYLKIRQIMTSLYIKMNEARRHPQQMHKYLSKDAINELRDNIFVRDIVETDKFDSDGKRLVHYKEYANYEETYFVSTAGLERLQADAANGKNNRDEAIQILDVDDKKVNGKCLVTVRKGIGDITKVEGYIPHFFHEYAVVVKDKDGNIVPQFKGDETGVLFTGRTELEAFNMAKEWEKEHPLEGGQKLYITPRGVDRVLGIDPEEMAPAIGDKDYAKMANGLAKKLGMTVADAERLMQDVVKKKARHRDLRNLQDRTNAAGFIQDMDWVLRHYIQVSTRYIAMESEFKPHAIGLFERVFGSFDADHSNNSLARYTKNFINDVNGNPRAIELMLNKTLNNWWPFRQFIEPTFGRRGVLTFADGLTRMITYLKLGMFNVSSALLNLTQLINSGAYLDDYGLLAKYIGTILKQRGKLTQTQLRILHESGVLNDLGLDTTTGFDKSNAPVLDDFEILWAKFKDNKIGTTFDVLDTLGNKSMILFQQMDSVCRVATTLAAYEKATAEGKSRTEAIAYAKKINRDANFSYGVEDAPNIIRALGPIGKIVFQFKKYSFKEMEVILDMLPTNSRTSFTQKMRFWFPYFLACGLCGIIPLGDWLDEFLNDKFNLFPKDFVQEVVIKGSQEFIGGELGKKVADILMYGGGAVANVDMSRRAGMASILPQDFLTAMLGPTGSTLLNTASGIAKGDTEGALQSFSPGIFNIYAAIRGGTHDKYGKPKTIYENAYDRLIRAMGFRSVDESAVADMNRIRMHERGEYSDERQRAMADFYEDRSPENARRMRELGITKKVWQNYLRAREMDKTQRYNRQTTKRERISGGWANEYLNSR